MRDRDKLRGFCRKELNETIVRPRTFSPGTCVHYAYSTNLGDAFPTSSKVKTYLSQPSTLTPSTPVSASEPNACV